MTSLNFSKLTAHSVIQSALCVQVASTLAQLGCRLSPLAGLTSIKLAIISGTFATFCESLRQQNVKPSPSKFAAEGLWAGVLAVTIKGISARPRDLFSTAVAIFVLNSVSNRLYYGTGLGQYIDKALV